MKLHLTVTQGPHQGKAFTFDGHDTFLVGRVNDAHLQLSFDDPYFSRRHFVLEVNPPRCRLLDLKSRNGTRVNNIPVEASEIKHGDVITAGHTVFQVRIEPANPEHQQTLDLPATLPDLQAVAPQKEALCVPGYDVGEELGRGGMGIVYRAMRRADRRPYALKVIIPALGVTPRQIDRFLREARILGKLSHPNIVAFGEMGNTGGAIFLAMELVRGPDCGKVLAEKGPMNPRTAVRVLCQMLAGLAHAHTQGYVHRDIKPSNILLALREDKKKVAKLADFGLAKAFATSQLSGITLQGEMGGTPAYMAPEQVTHFREVKPPADQYAAAATLYKLLTNQSPHNLPLGVAEALIHLSTKDPIPIQERNSAIPDGLAKVIHKGLRRETKDRYVDVTAFREALLPFAS